MVERRRGGCRLRSGLRLISPGLIAVGLLMALITSVQAQSDSKLSDLDWPGLTIEAAAGLGGVVNLDTPMPLSFLLRNDTERNLEGTMSLYLPATGQQIPLGDVVISPQSVKRFTAIQAISDWSDCRVMLTQGGKILWRRELDVHSGKPFNRNVNYALFVDGGARNLALPGVEADTTTTVEHDSQIARPNGRALRCLTAKPWQIPNHPGALIIIQAMIFPDGAAERELNPTQWKAMAQWICQGGIAFVHKSSPEIMERLLNAAPLSADTPEPCEAFGVRRIGLGCIYEYDQPLMSSGDNGIRDSIAKLVANRDRNQLHIFPDAHFFYNVERGGQFDKNRLLVFGLFTIYTLVSGGGALLLYRLNQKQIAAFALITVIIASVFAGLLGGYMRMSKGDATWMTVTYPGVGGMIQAGAIDVQSAGSRNTLVTVAGGDADLQVLNQRRTYFYYENYQQIGYSPFTWQPNLVPQESDKYQIRVTMSPWGQRRCHATAYSRQLTRMDVELEFTPQPATESPPEALRDTPNRKPSIGPKGNFRLKVENRLPFELDECQLVVGITCVPTVQELMAYQTWIQRSFARQNRTGFVDDLIDLYHVGSLPNLGSGTKSESDIAANFAPAEERLWWQYGFEFPPRISQMGQSKAWIVGKLKHSPILKIDEDLSDFSPGTGAHFFIQELLPDEVPDSLRKIFSKENPPTDPEKPNES